jgi:uncharacterized integral membrane protein
MARLIVTLGLLVILVVFIGLNLPYRTTVDLLGWRLPEVPSITVIMVSFIAGILLSLGFHFLGLLTKRNRLKLQERMNAARKKEEELAAREKALQSKGPAEVAPPPPPQPAVQRPVSRLEAWLRGGRRR